jgi:hypothetical protein
LVAILAFTSSCVTNVREGDPVTVGDGEHLVTLSFTIPGPPPSRAMSETEIDAVDVLLFDLSTDNNLVYRAIGTKPNSSNEFTVKLPDGTYNIVVLANARAMIPAAYPPATLFTAPPPLVSREDVLADITQTATGKYTAERVPMWGYKNSFTVGSGSSANIDLTRMIAKIDVAVDTDDVTDFWLESVRLYNYSSEGTVAPAVKTSAPNYHGYDPDQWDDRTDGIKAYGPNVPASAKVAAGVYIDYLLDAAPSDEVTATSSPVYTFEAEAGVAHPTAGWQENTCLVIGGYYKDKTTPTYYRVEFSKKESNGTYTYLPLLRNHHYAVTIIGVSAHGWPTPGDAYDHEPSNITVQITEWNSGGLDDITFNDQYHLAVDKSEITFYMEGYAKNMSVKTDFPTGWKVTDRPTWLTITDPNPAEGAPGVTAKLTLTASSIGAGDEREDFFYIVAGNLRKKIIVKQLGEPELSLEIMPEELTFYKTPAMAKNVLLLPLGGTTFAFNATGSLTWESGWDPRLPGDASTFLSGNVLGIWPGVNNTGYPLVGSVMVTLDGTNGSVSRAVNVRQLAREMLFEPTLANPYPAAAGDYTFTVKSEAPWQLAENPDETFLELEDESGYHPVSTAFTYNFSLTSNMDSFTPREVEIDVTSSDPEFYPIPAILPTFKIVQREGAIPFIDIDDPTDYPYDFGLAKTVTFQTNANWKFTTDANYASVIGSESVTPDQDQTTAATPTVPVAGSVTFSPASSSTDLAGSKSTSVTFQTVTPAGVTDDSEAISFSRVIPASFSVSSDPVTGTDIGTAASTVTLTANTNIRWWGRLGDSGTKINSAVLTAPKTNDQVTVTVPVLAWDAVASWSASTVTVQAGYNAQTDITASTPVVFTFNRPAYTLSVNNPGDIGFGVTSVTLTVTKTAPTCSIVFKIHGTSTIVGSTTTSGSTATISVAANSGTARSIDITNGVTGQILYTITQAESPLYYLDGPYSEWLSLADVQGRGRCPAGYHVDVDFSVYNVAYWLNGSLIPNGTYIILYYSASNPSSLYGHRYDFLGTRFNAISTNYGSGKIPSASFSAYVMCKRD